MTFKQLIELVNEKLRLSEKEELKIPIDFLKKHDEEIRTNFHKNFFNLMVNRNGR